MMAAKLLFLGIMAVTVGVNCGKDTISRTPTTLPPKSNHLSVASVTVAPAATAIAGATVVTFTATASDADGDNVTLSWQFGDGQVATGLTVQHTFVGAGTYAVVLAASDSHGGPTSVTTNVVVKGLTGDWGHSDPKLGFTLVQQGSQFSGTYDSYLDRTIAAVQGAVKDPRTLTFDLTYDVVVYPDNHHEQYQCFYEGALDAAGDVFHARKIGPRSDARCRETSFSATRQLD
jgi:PKD repeat protein